MNRNLFSLAALVLVMAACQPKSGDAPAADAEKTEASTTAATLTDAQKAEGWKLLFDGQTLNGWRFFKDQPNDTWEVLDGTLHCKPFVDGLEFKRADIMTVEQYENFELQFDWKISPQGNSGVMFRVTEEFDRPYYSGPEYQLIDNEGYPGDLKDSQLTGSNYDMHAVPDARPNAIGEWNTSKLVVNGDHVEHWLNGAKVLEYELNSDDWNTRKANSKWKDEKGYGQAKKGHIDFQDHDHEVWFKNIMIKEL